MRAKEIVGDKETKSDDPGEQERPKKKVLAARG